MPGYGDHLESTVDLDIRTRQADAPEGFEDVIGALVPLRDGEPPHSHVTFTVSDRDEAAAVAEQLGGTVLAREDSDWTRTMTSVTLRVVPSAPPASSPRRSSGRRSCVRIGRCTAGTCDSRSRPRVGQGAADRLIRVFLRSAR